MAFQNQFTLSLELTNVVPALSFAATKTWDAALSFARQLQSSRSDIVIEEDLAMKFGCCRVADNLARSFRTIVEEQNRQEPLQLVEAGIALISGTGPTVVRALTEGRDRPYFAMVVQCSFLVSTHLRRPLAAAIAQAFEKEAETAPSEYQRRAVPSAEGIEGTLQAIEDQTTSFDWRRLLIAVGVQLELDDESIYGTIPTTVLQGAILMFQSVQRFPEDRFVVIEVSNGAPALVVWAHHILGLSVLVRIFNDGKQTEESFGPRPEQVLIDVRKHYDQPNAAGEPISRPDSITLLSVKDDDQLKLVAENDDEHIDGTFRAPLRGFSKRQLASRSEVKKKPVLQQELALVVTAMANIISNHLAVAASEEDIPTYFHRQLNDQASDSGNPTTPTEPSQSSTILVEPKTHMPLPIDQQRLLSACQLMFDQPKLNQSRVDEYMKMFEGQPLTSLPIPVGIIDKALESPSEEARESSWSYLRLISSVLAVAAYGFASVGNLGAAADLPLYDDSSMLGESSLAMKIMGWDGYSNILIEHTAAFEIVSCLMLGQYSDVDISEACLVSNKGWSVFLSSLGEDDPAAKEKEIVFVAKGVPCRNEVRKHLIVDAASPVLAHHTWQLQDYSGSEVQLRCHEGSRMRFGTPYCGERRDSFVLSLRLIKINADGQTESEQTRRTGYSEKHRALWRTRTTKACLHGPSANKKHVLPPGCVTVSGFGDHGVNLSNAPFGLVAKVYICLTAGNKASRWRALIAAAATQEDADCFVPIMLRGSGCCFKCAVDQTLEREGVWYLIL